MTKSAKFCFPKIREKVEIMSLCEIEDDGSLGAYLGFFAESHWEAQSFAIAVNQEHDLASIEQPVRVADVKHGYAKKLLDEDLGKWIFHVCDEDQETFKCTYVFYDN